MWYPAISFRRWAYVAVVVLGLAGLAVAQRFSSMSYGDAPESNAKPGFEKDVFTFVRIKYKSEYGYGWNRGRGDWKTDHPDADWNLAYRLQQMTSLKVRGEGLIMELTDPELFNYPFIYMVEVGDLLFDEEEVLALRKYLLNGGFLMVDDFWGEPAWEHFAGQMKRVFPDRTPQEIPIEHPIFNIVFTLKEKPQIPNVGTGTQSQYTGVTWETWDSKTPHYKGLYDDKGRLMAVICHNTDLGDGWEREGNNYYYFKEFSEKKAYPLGINIIVYAMTH